ncbi:hypothetical protein [Nesterenkonia xinjiangensis]|uniref:Uncharacterized protein n=1 Tax=Nesterenkonia xinjiangensis TaxID=225327 RepID=A0A7Z0KD10_9MICC|nr:hypothetical protein [Nesterenkonia xinjiangensis]NYJ79177.1 hypothetical protein [Nesterenkonia xinjiangensis]
MTDERLIFGATGLDAATERYRVAERALISRPEDTRPVEAAVLECAWWCQMLNERLEKTATGYREARSNDAAGQTVQGVRFARNRYSHSPVVAVERVEGVTFPITFPASFGVRVIWRGVKALGRDERDSKGQQRAYAELLAGRHVAETLATASRWFQRWGVPAGG